MFATKIIKIKTPKKYLLDALLLGPEKAKTVFIFVHGLGSSLFSQLELTSSLVSKNSSVIIFNNRGFGTVNKISKLDKRRKRGYKNLITGFSYEVFTDCLDDIDGAFNQALKLRAKNIILLGHSTGCQKSIYYLAKRKNKKVSAAILLAPMSDFASMYASIDRKKYEKLIKTAKQMIEADKGFTFMPFNLWPIPITAQRFLSLFSPESEEEIFSYASNKKAKTLKTVKNPLLVVLGENDEHRQNLTMIDIASWFESVLANKDKQQVKIIKKANHGFSENVLELNKLIKNWLKDNLTINC